MVLSFKKSLKVKRTFYSGLKISIMEVKQARACCCLKYHAEIVFMIHWTMDTAYDRIS